MTRDPVCGKNVLQLSEATKKEYQGRIYYFCSTQCRQAFEQEPERYGAVAPALGWRPGGKSPSLSPQALQQEPDHTMTDVPRPAWRLGGYPD